MLIIFGHAGYLLTLRPRGPANDVPYLGEGDVVLFVYTIKSHQGLPWSGLLVRVADVCTRGTMLRRLVRNVILMEAKTQPGSTEGILAIICDVAYVLFFSLFRSISKLQV